MRIPLRIALIAGDGIGKEVVPLSRDLLNQFKRFQFDFVDLDAGWDCFNRTGHALPSQTIKELEKCNGAIFGAVSSPSGKVEGYRSPIVQLRKDFGLYANVRPAISLPRYVDVVDNKQNVDMVIVRENTECLYTGKEEVHIEGNPREFFSLEDGPLTGFEVATCIRRISEPASEKIARIAGKIALKRKHLQPQVTICHKANVLPISDGLFLNTCRNTLAGLDSSIRVNDCLVDSLAMHVINTPHKFNVIVCPNLYGDILSDIASAITGGLGVSAGINIGDNFAVAEPVHGSAPNIEGQGIANPIATFRSVGLLLDHITQGDFYFKEINKAINNVIMYDYHYLTPDIGGSGTTTAFAKEIIRNINAYEPAT